MAKVFIEETTLTAIGDAIRGKTGKTDLIDPANMSTEIAGIEAGSGDIDIPESTFSFTGNCDYRLIDGRWDWLIKLYGHKFSFNDVTSANQTLAYTKLEEIPFQLNIKDNSKISMSMTFAYAYNLKVCPKIRGVIDWSSSSTSLNDLLVCAYHLRDMEDLFTSEMIEGFSNTKCTSSYSMPKLYSPAKHSYSLRRMPSWWYKFKLNPESTAFPTGTYTLYNNAFKDAASLDEVTNIPVWKCQAGVSSNMFSSAFNGCDRLNTITFETNNDGSPIETMWKNQVIDLCRVGTTLGWGSLITGYNSGITEATFVKDDASYQALKNDPDWWTNDVPYSRYNHDSAVETINSLPDTSAYGTNTIKFTGAAGNKTDGGAIRTLTEEEIAVATAKGWTVTFA